MGSDTADDEEMEDDSKDDSKDECSSESSETLCARGAPTILVRSTGKAATGFLQLEISNSE